MTAGQPVRILVLGASYGLLPGIKLSLAGHCVTLVGRPDEIAAMGEVVSVQLPARRTTPDVVLAAPVARRAAPGQVALVPPHDAPVDDANLVILAMQEPHYADPAVALLMGRIAAARRPCLSIMNLAPPPFLARLGITDGKALAGVYHSAAVWAGFAPDRMTLASPDPQAIRPDPTKPGQLVVTLPSNFKAAPFARPEDQLLLQRLAADMSHLEVAVGSAKVRPPVALLAGSALFVPLAKWPMLIAGNCRCLLPDGVRTIAQAVLHDVPASRAIYESVSALAISLGARAQDMVSFDVYAKAAASLTRPSSLARALMAGAERVERVDRLVRNLMVIRDQETALIDPIVALIDSRTAANARTP